MKLLVDTDAFCKLAVAELLREAIKLQGAELSDCGRLPALPYMLGKGRLRERFGPEACDKIAPLAKIMPKIGPPNPTWLDRLAGIQAIDPGEAQIFAAAAEGKSFVLSGDKRALRSLKHIQEYREALSGRIVVMEAMLLALCDDLGPDLVRRRVEPLRSLDTVIKTCFSPQGSDPNEGLLSYYRSLASELTPLQLWVPISGLV